jgi:hypothetical protein
MQYSCVCFMLCVIFSLGLILKFNTIYTYDKDPILTTSLYFSFGFNI